MVDQIKPKIREEATRRFRKAVSDACFSAIESQIKDFPFQSCINCLHFDEHQGEICRVYKARPPARVIAFGCISFADDDDIPF